MTPSDPSDYFFEEYVYFRLGVVCARCAAELRPVRSLPAPGEEWVREQALQMKEGGWFIFPDEIWTSLCPECLPFQAESRESWKRP